MNSISKTLLGLAAALALSAVAHAASPLGTWTMNGNGSSGTLTINSVAADGTITGTVLGSVLKGFYSDSAGRLVFYRAISGSTSSTPPELIQIYEGYLHPCFSSNPNGSQCIEGSFQAFAGTGATASKNVFGWYAFK